MAQNVTNNFVTLISNSKDNVEKIADKISEGKELEFIFFSGNGEYMNKDKYMYIGKYMSGVNSSGEYKLGESTYELDLNLSLSENETLRVTVKKNGADDTVTSVYTSLLERANNYSALRMALYLARKSKDKSKYGVMIKSRSPENTFDINEFNIRCKLSGEKDIYDDLISNSENLNPMIKKLLEGGDTIPIERRKEINKQIVYRYKERLSLIYEQTKDHLVKLDMTFVKSGKNLRRLSNEMPNYELELEIQAKKMTSKLKDLIYDRLESIVELIQRSNFIVSNGMKNKVIDYYKQLVIGSGSAKITALGGRQPVSLQLHHTTVQLPDKYAVTDKADGDRAVLIIYDGQIYLIHNNLNVRDTGIVLKSALAKKYNGSIMDGEFIYCEEYDRHVFMTFDCLFSCEKDVRGEESIMKRLSYADEIIAECFTDKEEKGFTFTSTLPKMESFDLDKVANFHSNEIKKYYKNIIDDISQWSVYPLIRRKYFIPVNGAMKWEIFKYSLTFWKLYSEDSETQFPYHLDGLIYHPLYQIYTTDKHKSKFEDYKWKPPSHNSIDFYVEFQKDPKTQRDYIIYDNTNKVKNRPYKICNLHVGKNTGNQERPTPFILNNGYSEAYLFLEDGEKEVRDLDGEIILGGTVVEFAYNNDPSLAPRQRWVPMRTRHDKTSFVERYRRTYGNYITVAENVWRSIMNPINMSDFADLAIGSSKYHDKINELNSKVDRSTVIATSNEKQYYVSNKLATEMKWYHNWIKSNILYTHGHHMYRFGIPQSVLDLACGVGGDNLKHYYNELSYCVGIDYDLNGLISPVNGAISRYNQMRKGKANFPPMHFIHSDLRALLNADDQMKALGGMTSENEKLLRKFFPKDGKVSTFDMVSCQMAIHYFLEDTESWKNFKQNVKNHLKVGGTFVVTTLSGEAVRKVLEGKERFTEYYTTSKGEKQILFDIVKKYEDGVQSGIGNKIDYHGAWMFAEGDYHSEFLVDKDFLVSELEKDCDLELIDHDLFENQFNIHRDYLMNYAKYQSNVSTRNMLLNVAKYYEDTEANKSMRKFTNLHAYYIFRKKGIGELSYKKDNMNKKGGGQKYDLTDGNRFGILKMEKTDSNRSLINSIHTVLTKNKIIPEISSKTMCKELGINMVNDVKLDEKKLKKICKSIVIDHSVDDPNNLDGTITENVLDGLNIITVSLDCNNHYDIEYINKKRSVGNKNNEKYVILMKEGVRYYPLYEKEKNDIGIFSGNDDLVTYLTENGTNITP